MSIVTIRVHKKICHGARYIFDGTRSVHNIDDKVRYNRAKVKRPRLQYDSKKLRGTIKSQNGESDNGLVECRVKPAANDEARCKGPQSPKLSVIKARYACAPCRV